MKKNKINLRIEKVPQGKPLGSPRLVFDNSLEDILRNVRRDKSLSKAKIAVIGKGKRIRYSTSCYGGGIPPMSYESVTDYTVYPVQFYS